MLNKIVLMGRLTAEPEYRQTPEGVSVTTFSLAVDRNYVDAQGTRKADFLPCVAWRGTAEFISKYFVKGQLIVVVGSLQTRKYLDKQEQMRTAYEIVVEQAYFAGSNKGGDENPGAANTAGAPSVPDQEDDGDLPF